MTSYLKAHGRFGDRRISSSAVPSLMVLAFVVMAQSAHAQEAASSETVGQVQEVDANAILITGTRIKRNGFNEPTPATVIGSDLMADLGQVNTAGGG